MAIQSIDRFVGAPHRACDVKRAGGSRAGTRDRKAVLVVGAREAERRLVLNAYHCAELGHEVEIRDGGAEPAA